MQKSLVIVGLIIVALGVCYPWIVNIFQNVPLGRLPGDIHYKSERMIFSFPLVTCLVVSAILSGIFWLIRRF